VGFFGVVLRLGLLKGLVVSALPRLALLVFLVLVSPCCHFGKGFAVFAWVGTGVFFRGVQTLCELLDWHDGFSITPIFRGLEERN